MRSIDEPSRDAPQGGPDLSDSLGRTLSQGRWVPSRSVDLGRMAALGLRGQRPGRSAFTICLTAIRRMAQKRSFNLQSIRRLPSICGLGLDFLGSQIRIRALVPGFLRVSATHPGGSARQQSRQVLTASRRHRLIRMAEAAACTEQIWSLPFLNTRLLGLWTRSSHSRIGHECRSRK